MTFLVTALDAIDDQLKAIDTHKAYLKGARASIIAALASESSLRPPAVPLSELLTAQKKNDDVSVVKEEVVSGGTAPAAVKFVNGSGTRRRKGLEQRNTVSATVRDVAVQAYREIGEPVSVADILACAERHGIEINFANRVRARTTQVLTSSDDFVREGDGWKPLRIRRSKKVLQKNAAA